MKRILLAATAILALAGPAAADDDWALECNTGACAVTQLYGPDFENELVALGIGIAFNPRNIAMRVRSSLWELSNRTVAAVLRVDGHEIVRYGEMKEDGATIILQPADLDLLAGGSNLAIGISGVRYSYELSLAGSRIAIGNLIRATVAAQKPQDAPPSDEPSPAKPPRISPHVKPELTV